MGKGKRKRETHDATSTADTQLGNPRRRRDGKDFSAYLMPLAAGESMYSSHPVMEMMYFYEEIDKGSESLVQYMVQEKLVPISSSAISKRYMRFRDSMPENSKHPMPS
jgi:hypothetical protein